MTKTNATQYELIDGAPLHRYRCLECRVTYCIENAMHRRKIARGQSVACHHCKLRADVARDAALPEKPVLAPPRRKRKAKTETDVRICLECPNEVTAPRRKLCEACLEARRAHRCSPVIVNQRRQKLRAKARPPVECKDCAVNLEQAADRHRQLCEPCAAVRAEAREAKAREYALQLRGTDRAKAYQRAAQERRKAAGIKRKWYPKRKAQLPCKDCSCLLVGPLPRQRHRCDACHVVYLAGYHERLKAKWRLQNKRRAERVKQNER